MIRKLEILFGSREKELFLLYEKLGDYIEQASQLILQMVQDLNNGKRFVRELHIIEHECDEIIHQIFCLVSEVSILPFDYEDIDALAKNGDSVIDLLWGGANRIYILYKLSDPDPELAQIAVIIVNMAKEVKNLFANLKNLKKIKNLQEIINRFHREENQADELRDSVLNRRFELTLKDLKQIPIWLAWKEVYEHLERATDRFVDITDIIGHFHRKYS